MSSNRNELNTYAGYGFSCCHRQYQDAIRAFQEVLKLLPSTETVMRPKVCHDIGFCYVRLVVQCPNAVDTIQEGLGKLPDKLRQSCLDRFSGLLKEHEPNSPFSFMQFEQREQNEPASNEERHRKEVEEVAGILMSLSANAEY